MVARRFPPDRPELETAWEEWQAVLQTYIAHLQQQADHDPAWAQERDKLLQLVFQKREKYQSLYNADVE